MENQDLAEPTQAPRRTLVQSPRPLARDWEQLDPSHSDRRQLGLWGRLGGARIKPLCLHGYQGIVVFTRFVCGMFCALNCCLQSRKIHRLPLLQRQEGKEDKAMKQGKKIRQTKREQTFSARAFESKTLRIFQAFSRYNREPRRNYLQDQKLCTSRKCKQREREKERERDLFIFRLHENSVRNEVRVFLLDFCNLFQVDNL
jgi:hypothetical protein